MTLPSGTNAGGGEAEAAGVTVGSVVVVFC